MADEKQAVYLMMKTELVKEDENRKVVSYAPLFKAARLNEALKWNMIELKDYMLSNEPDFAGETYDERGLETVDVINKHYILADENPEKVRVDLYLFPKEGGENDKFMVRPYDNVSDLVERVLQETTQEIGGKDVTQSNISGIFTITIGLGDEILKYERGPKDNLYLAR